MQAVVFRINEEQFAIDASKVSGINEVLNITPVPKAPDYIKGLCNLRGSILSILDMHKLLNMERSREKDSNIIIVNINDELLGLTVDQVDEVIDIEEEKIEGDNKKISYIKGIINFNDRIVTFIEIEKILLN